MDLAEKHRPRSLSDIIGNKKAIDELVRWLKNWPNEKKGAIISGPPGIGKTSAALALASAFGYDVIEMNASDARNYDSVRSIAMRGAVNGSLFGEGGKLIILDEADNLSGVEDRGGIKAIAETLQVTKQPIILIANDLYALTSRSQSFNDHCITIKFSRPRKDEIFRLLKRIVAVEGMDVNDETLQEISETCNGDVRSAIRDLEGGGVSYRDRERNIFDVLPLVFRAPDLRMVRGEIMSLDMEPRDVLLWADENAPAVFNGEAMVRAYDQMARIDLYLGRAQRRQNYSMWRYATALMSFGHLPGHGAQFSFPNWLRKMSRYKSRRALREDMLKKLSLHASGRKAKTEIMPYLVYMMRKDEMLAASIAETYQLSDEELGLLTGEVKKPSKSKLKNAPVDKF